MMPRILRSIRERDPLALLTATTPIQYRKGAIIYSATKQPAHLHVVIRGRVKVTRGLTDHSVVVDLYGPEDFFGECAFLDFEQLPEQAMAMEKTEVMRWTSAEIERLVLNRPQLGMALLQALALRSVDCGARLHGLLRQKTAGRLLQSLVRLSERCGAMEEGGSVRLAPLTHRLLSEYTGTSREIVTLHMNNFRRQGLLNYSRKEIILTPRAFEAARNGCVREAA